MLTPIVRLLDYIFVLRPIILIPAWSFFLLGIARSPAFVRTPATDATLAALTAILISGYLLNQVFDRESDEANNKCPHLSLGIFTPRTLVVMALVFFVMASLASQRVGGASRLLLIGAVALSLTYSLPPVRLCTRPILDMLANAVGYGGGAFLLGFLAGNGSFGTGVAIGWPYVLLVAATFMFTTILDVDGDRVANKLSTTVWMGVFRSYVFAGVLHVAALVWAVMIGDLMMTIVCGASLPFTGYAVWRRSDGASKLAVQGNTLVVTLAAVVVFPWYAAVIVPLIVASRFYYKRRFGLDYPGPAKSAEPTAQ